MEDNTHTPPPTSEAPVYAERSTAAQLWYDTRLCIGFLTRIPVFTHEYAGQTSLAAASWAFPLGGLLIGLVGALVLWIADSIGLTSELSALLALASMVIITGALHEDGLADTADGFGLSGDTERRLAAMRDSSIGVYGMVALIIVFGARWMSLADLAAPSIGYAAETLMAGAAISRGVLPYVMHAVPNARTDGLSVAAGRPEAKPALIALAIAAVVAILAFGFGSGIVVMAVAGLVAYAVTATARRLIRGQTGDVLGAIQQLVDAAVLITAAGLIS